MPGVGSSLRAPPAAREPSVIATPPAAFPRRIAVLALVVLTSLLAGACTSDGPGPRPQPSASPTPAPSPTPGPVSGPRIAVVLPPPEVVGAEEIDVLRTEVESVGREFAEQIDEWRIVRPDGRRFVEDVVVLLADEGFDLVCTLGPGSGAAARAVAALDPRTRFCAAPAAPGELPTNLLEVDYRVEELAFLAGVAAAVRTDGDAPVGLIAGETPYRSAEQRIAFFRGVRSVTPDAPEPLLAFPASDAERADELAAGLLDAGARVLLTIAGAADEGVLDAVAAAAEAEQQAADGVGTAEPPAGASPTPAPSPDPRRPPVVIGASATLLPAADGADEEVEPGRSVHVLATTRMHLTVGLRIAVQRLLEGWVATPVSLGMADKALSFEVGPGPVPPALADRVEEGRQLIIDGEVDVLPPEQQ